MLTGVNRFARGLRRRVRVSVRFRVGRVQPVEHVQNLRDREHRLIRIFDCVERMYADVNRARVVDPGFDVFTVDGARDYRCVRVRRQTDDHRCRFAVAPDDADADRLAKPRVNVRGDGGERVADGVA